MKKDHKYQFSIQKKDFTADWKIKINPKKLFPKEQDGERKCSCLCHDSKKEKMQTPQVAYAKNHCYIHGCSPCKKPPVYKGSK